MSFARRRPRLLVALAGAGLLALASVALATHPRPKAANKASVSLVTAFEQCTSPNSTHGPPLQFPSCSPPVEASHYVTVGTPAANGADANSVGGVRIKVRVGNPGPPEDAALDVQGRITDVRCKPAATTCGGANAQGGPDYTGELDGEFTVRVTDHLNGPSGSDAGTVVDLPQPFTLHCAATADTSIGSTCSFPVVTCSSCPPPKEGVRTVIEVSQIQIRDGGADGRVATDPNTLFMVQGVFIP